MDVTFVLLNRLIYNQIISHKLSMISVCNRTFKMKKLIALENL